MSTVCKGSLMQFFMPYPLRTSTLQDVRIRRLWPRVLLSILKGLRWRNERPAESDHNWCQHLLRGLHQHLHPRQWYLWLQSLQLRRPKLPLLSGPEPSMLLLTYSLLRWQSRHLQRQALWLEEWLDVKWPKRKLGLPSSHYYLGSVSRTSGTLLLPRFSGPSRGSRRLSWQSEGGVPRGSSRTLGDSP